MARIVVAIFGLVAWCIAFTSLGMAAEQIGKATAITVTVTGGSGPISVNSPIYRDERIRVSSSGAGQFVFRDGTKLAVGPNSSLVLDRSIFDDSDSFKTLTINATKGSFRWISGSSKSSAYKIKTPLGTLGVRGTAFDFYVGPSSATIVLIKGQADLCGKGGCRRLSNGCDAAVATPGGVSTIDPKSKTVVRGVKDQTSFPFMTGQRRLPSAFLGSGGCDLKQRTERGFRKKASITDKRFSERNRDGDSGAAPVQNEPEAPSRNPNGPE